MAQTARQRRDAIRARLQELGAEAFFVSRLVNVRYLTGFSGSNGQLLIRAAGDTLLTDSRYEEQSARQVPDIERRVYTSGVTVADALAELVDGAVGTLAVEAHDVTLAGAAALRAKLPGASLVETTGVVEELRIVKSREEIAAVARACAIGDTALEVVLGRLKEGMSERDAASELEDAMRRAGSEGLSFPTIAAFGENGAEPHHAPGDRTLRNGDLVKLDFGATYDGYHSDMTRTIAFGRVSDEARRIYSLVRDSQQRGVERVRPGVTTGEVDAASRDVVEAAGYVFGHGVGHGVGLDVHEAPSVRRDSMDTLVEGMVVTVEPGVYIPGFGGVRIEDTVAVTSDGCDVLTRSPKELIEV